MPARSPLALAGRASSWLRQGERRWTLLVLGSYLLLVVAYTWPAVLQFRTRVWGQPGDLWIALWDAWWFERVVQHHDSPLYTRWLFFPQGVSLAYHSISWMSAAIAFPLRALFGPFGGFNLMTWLETWLCAASMYALARKLMRGHVGPWLAGLVFAFEPFRVSRALHHPNLAGTGFIPLVLLFVLRTWRGQGLKNAWFAALALVAVLLTGAHLFIMTVAALALVFVSELLQERRFKQGAFWLGNAHFVSACLLLVTPFAYQYLASPRALQAAVHAVSLGSSSDLLALVVPGPDHLLFRGFAQEPYRFYGESGSVAYLGIGACVLAALLFVRPDTRRGGLRWFTGFVAFLVLSFGPTLIANHHTVLRWMPYRLVAGFTAVQAVRDPERFNLIARLFFALCCGFGGVALEQLMGSRRRWALPALALVAVDLALPSRARAWPEPQFYRELGQSGGRGAILELPLTREAAKRSMLSQTVHRRPLVGGMIARPTAEAFRYLQTQPLLKVLRGGSPAPFRCGSLDLQHELAELRKDGVEYVVVRLKHMTRRQRTSFATYLRGKPRFADDQIEAYAISDLLAKPPRCASDP